MKKTIAKLLICILTAAILLPVLTCCSTTADDGKYSIVCTIFPEYDFIMNILGDKADLFDVTMLISNGTDMHSYQPTVSDIAKISNCDIFVYVGNTSQNWADNILKNVNKEKTDVVCLTDKLEDELCSHTHTEDENHNHSEGFDEHVWLSLKKSQKIVDALCASICKTDFENKEIYQANADQYKSQIANLDTDFKNSLETAQFDTMIFADRFPFVYLLEDYGIKHYAAFTGCSTDSDAGVKTILDLAGKLNELSLPYVMVIETSNKTVANTVINESGCNNVGILTLNSCQTITKKQIDDGVTYIDIMKTNLDSIKTALGCEA